MRFVDADAIEKDLGVEDRDLYVQHILDSAPTIEAEPKHGRWMPVANGRGGFECSICNNYAPSYKNGDEWLSDYCPRCGARMDEVKE